jgi:hypothetical protein
MIVRSPMMRTPTNYIIKPTRGFHYYKMLSPFKSIEWMMVDGLYQNKGISDESVVKEKL